MYGGTCFTMRHSPSDRAAPVVLQRSGNKKTPQRRPRSPQPPTAITTRLSVRQPINTIFSCQHTDLHVEGVREYWSPLARRQHIRSFSAGAEIDFFSSFC